MKKGVGFFATANASLTFKRVYINGADTWAAVLGPRQLEGPLLIPITVFYILIFLSGVIGNVSVRQNPFHHLVRVLISSF
jgi:hypothetical protein